MEEGERVVYGGRISQVEKTRKGYQYIVKYWLPDDDEELGEDYELAADFVAGE